jgi:N-carbamoylputrescine amidase
MAIVKVAGVQSACGQDREENVARAVGLARLAAENGAGIICFEQLFSLFWFPREKSPAFFDLAEAEDGPTIETLRALAKEKGVTLICPIFERVGEHEYYNTAFIIGPDGELLGKYRKIHLPDLDLWREKFYFSPGNLGFPVFTSHGLTFGVQLCWDNFFPEGARRLALKGAQVIFCPNAAAFASSRKWETVITANSIVNGIYLFRVNRVGREEKQDFYGRSFCVNPEGEMLLPPSGMSNSVIMADIDTDLIDEVRREWKFFRDRREDVYGQ